MDVGPPGAPGRTPPRGLAVSPIEAPLLDAVLRLLQLLDTPHDIGILAPLVLREISYRLLMGDQGARLRQIAAQDSQAQRMAAAIHWLQQNFARPLRIETLAREVHLSASALHHQFKAVTAMSPLQYQKQLRLQEARRLMLAEALDAATAGLRVGYESPSQFSREYRRLFGAPPQTDVASLRGTALLGF
jgi:AraC-like DNA-binding protein